MWVYLAVTNRKEWPHRLVNTNFLYQSRKYHQLDKIAGDSLFCFLKMVIWLAMFSKKLKLKLIERIWMMTIINFVLDNLETFVKIVSLSFIVLPPEKIKYVPHPSLDYRFLFVLSQSLSYVLVCLLSLFIPLYNHWQ